MSLGSFSKKKKKTLYALLLALYIRQTYVDQTLIHAPKETPIFTSITKSIPLFKVLPCIAYGCYRWLRSKEATTGDTPAARLGFRHHP
ncbi:hypothetical protein HanRHA438_Chr13g0603451 [Helianthus annuus]|nr:hypothetical protein HanPSC8_Chr13g0570781 [Helianthus annuus]KAJ0858653.1 hypothetical protein HanRHA438_Chr13g0603451 [Helianthus annuus]